MAPTSNQKGGKSTIKGMKSLIQQFCSVTGAEEDVARRMIEACNGNIEMAVNMHIESQSVTTTHQNSPQCSENTVVPDPNVRAPIPQTKGVLIEEGFMHGFRGRRRATQSVFDGFRDFQAETKWQEEELMNGGPTISSRKHKTLEELFRPPLDIMHKGSFESAKEKGRASNRWLMVNIQNSKEFSCQMLNRDVWSSSVVKSVVIEHFVFWQVYHDSEDGKRYSLFYKVEDFPYIAVLDPRTGEKLVVWNKVDALTFCDVVTQFLTEHKILTSSSSSPPAKRPRESIVDASEDSQLEAALAASLNEPSDSKKTDGQSDDDSEVETFESDDDVQIDVTSIEKVADDWKEYIGDENGPQTSLIFRYPDGKRDELSLPSSSKLKAVSLYVQSKGFPNEHFELVTNFPKRNLSNLSFDESLTHVGLSHQETVFIQTRHLSSDEDVKDNG